MASVTEACSQSRQELSSRTVTAVGCGTGRRLPWASITDGWTTPYKSKPPIPTQTDGANYDLDKIKAGTLNLATTINEVVLDSHCNPIIL